MILLEILAYVLAF